MGTYDLEIPSSGQVPIMENWLGQGGCQFIYFFKCGLSASIGYLDGLRFMNLTLAAKIPKSVRNIGHVLTYS